MSELKHYGVIGMKWGVRRYQPYPDGKHGRFLGRRKKDQPVKKPKETPVRTTGDLSDDELRKIVNRIQLEQQYAKLTAKQKSKGMQLVTDILGNSAKQAATEYTKKQMVKALETALGEEKKKK